MQPHNFDVDIVIPSSNQKVKINKDFIQVNQATIACADVTAVKYGVSLIGKRKKPTKYYGIEGRILTIKDVLKWWREIENKQNEMKIYINPDYKEFLEEIELCEMKDLNDFWSDYSIET